MTETWRRMLSLPPLSPYIRDGGSGLLSWEGDLRRVVIIIRKTGAFELNSLHYAVSFLTLKRIVIYSTCFC